MHTTATDHSVAARDIYGPVTITEGGNAPPPYTPPAPPDPATLPDPGTLPPGSRLPFSRNADFTGREEQLRSLGRTLLTEDDAAPALITQAIQGLGGVGKTQLAAEFAHRYGCFFHSVHWINAAQPEDIPVEVAACGALMALPNWPEALPDQVAYTLRAWGDGLPRLLLLDNLEDVPAAREWLGRLGAGRMRILLTARRANWPPDMPLDPLPLALFLAGRYLARTPSLSIADYLARLETVFAHRSMQGWQAEMGNPTGHDLDLLATFALSWEQVEDETARRVFFLAAHCAPNAPIPRPLLARAAEIAPEECDESLDTLLGLGLLLPPAQGEQEPAIHPLPAEYGRGLEQDPHSALSALADALRSLSYAALETGLLGNFVPLRPHLRLAAEETEQAGLEQAGALWNNLGSHLRAIADLDGARAAYERALAVFERSQLPPEHPHFKAALAIEIAPGEPHGWPSACADGAASTQVDARLQPASGRLAVANRG